MVTLSLISTIVSSLLSQKSVKVNQPFLHADLQTHFTLFSDEVRGSEIIELTIFEFYCRIFPTHFSCVHEKKE